MSEPNTMQPMNHDQDNEDDGHVIAKIKEPYPSQESSRPDLSSVEPGRTCLREVDSEHVHVDLHETEVYVRNNPEIDITSIRLTWSAAQELHHDLQQAFENQ